MVTEEGEGLLPGAAYQCHKRVRAFCIARIVPNENSAEDPAGAVLVPDDEFQPDVAVTGEYLAKHRPEVGGYWVQYEDGYQSFSPATAFEQGYALIPE